MHFDCQSAAGFRINRMAEGQEPPRTVASFESSLEELEKVVKELESGDLPLDRSLELFSRGMELSEACRKQLVRKDGGYQPEPLPNNK